MTTIIYTKANCPYCIKAKTLLDKKNIPYQEIDVEHDPKKRQEMIAKSQRHTVPQIFISNTHIGGCDDLYKLEEKGNLDSLLNHTSSS